ncbi:hypothetical protein EGR_00392 [Echinococcus granulosus]|uniref:WW domain-containing protein n=1 Tax=Echinococcus granulosus TaxID=6210 RepID=W6UUY8_ECHGR|nr:hypothetical protein EGR_00392 [Echinococcus granulosus]EUB65123.1 hypothetical protein EGR_00392 [Echinococcus granulosus]
MPKSNRWKEYPLPSNWEERYDPSTKLNYFVDHAKKRASWTDPRTWYYDNDVTSTGGETNLRENNNEALSDRRFLVYVATNRNMISYNEDVNPHQPLEKVMQALSPTATSAHVSCQLRHHSSHRVATANPGSIKDDATLGEVVVGERVPKHEVVKQSTPVPETRELCLAPLHVGSAPAQDDVKGTRGLKTFHSKGDGNPERICEVLEHCRLSKPNKAVILSSLLIRAKGPDQSLLCRRIPARGPDPSLGRGPNPSLVRGPNPALLRKNQPQALSSAP